MAIVKLGDVANESKLSYKGDKSNMKIVGLEHLTPESVTLTVWSENTENTFTKRFLKGQVLFGRRRAYLKKAAVAPFDGVCSGDITVIEAIPGKINEQLLPFIIQNEKFFDYAVEKSAGSLSPRVKWEHLKDYEFELPDIAEQERLAKILCEIQNDIINKEKALKSIDSYLLSLEDQSFLLHLDEDEAVEGRELKTISDIAYIDPAAPKLLPDMVSFIGMKDVSEDGRIIALQDRLSNELKNGYTYFSNGDILFAKITPCMENGKGAIAEGLTNGIGFGSTEFFVLRSKDEIYNSYLYALIMSKKFRKLAEGWMQGSAGQRRVSKDIFSLRKMWLPKNKEMLISIGQTFKDIKILKSKLIDSILSSKVLLKAIQKKI